MLKYQLYKQPRINWKTRLTQMARIFREKRRVQFFGEVKLNHIFLKI